MTALATLAPTAGPATPVPYATPVARPGARAWAGAAIVLGGLCLILLGGCFLIGVLGMVHPTALNGTNLLTPPLTNAQVGLIAALYGLAFLCFAGAAALLFAGTRGLLRVMKP